MITGYTPGAAHSHLSKRKRLSNEAKSLSISKLDLYGLPNKKKYKIIIVYEPTLYKTGTGYSLHQAPETPDNIIYWPNADVMLCHCL